ncbi:hypothetical protein [Arsenicicoccus dermatophilus]|uniref:hypothetical protein n=1 Tax=Arsenicicoccus dermatophilus TaxID=1076331 RepID=UPI0039174208
MTDRTVHLSAAPPLPSRLGTDAAAPDLTVAPGRVPGAAPGGAPTEPGEASPAAPVEAAPVPERTVAPMTDREWAGYALGASALAVLGSFGPWLIGTVMTSQLTVAGTQGDGVYTLALGLLAAATAHLHRRRGGVGMSWAPWTLAALGAGCAGSTVPALRAIATTHRDGLSMSPGWGLIVALLSGTALAAVGVAWALTSRPRPDRPTPAVAPDALS